MEITSPGENPRQKNEFYARVGTREVLVIDRDPWGLELFQLDGSLLRSVWRADAQDGAVLTSATLPFAFQLRAATPRPAIVVTHTGTSQTDVDGVIKRCGG